MRSKRRWTTTLAGGLLLLVAGSAAGATLTGVFEVNNTLPQDASLAVAVGPEGTSEATATTAVEETDGAIAYTLEGIEPGTYRIDLMATVGDVELVLARLEGVAVGDSETTAPTTDAIGVDGAVAGEITLSGEPPAERLLLVRADRTDIEVEGMPDALNRLSYEVSKEEIAVGTLAYEFEGMSYGLYRVELIGYDYKTHQVEVYGALDRTLPVDATTPVIDGASFTVDLEPAAD